MQILFYKPFKNQPLLIGYLQFLKRHGKLKARKGCLTASQVHRLGWSHPAETALNLQQTDPSL